MKVGSLVRYIRDPSGWGSQSQTSFSSSPKTSSGTTAVMPSEPECGSTTASWSSQ